MMNLPFLTLSDPLVSGEGALDPLGLSSLADHLANQILPGFRARMSRPRFLTAMVVSAAVCEGLPELSPADGVTPPFLAFEWLVVEAFVRGKDRERTRGTPGTLKAKQVIDSGDVMSPRSYLKTPTVFGFHGIYKPLALRLRLVSDELALDEAGTGLLKAWQADRGLTGFTSGALEDGPGRMWRRQLSDAVGEGLRVGHTKRSAGWSGWTLLMNHLAPAAMGPEEARLMRRLLDSEEECPQRELLALLSPHAQSRIAEATLTMEVLLPKAGVVLKPRLEAIAAYEHVATLLERGFDLMRHLSTRIEGRALTPADCAADDRFVGITDSLPAAIQQAEAALALCPLAIQRDFTALATYFDAVKTPEDLFRCLLDRHASVQQAKPPDGKREWFERANDGGALVRVPYRHHEPLDLPLAWARPYRLAAATSFLRDLGGANGSQDH